MISIGVRGFDRCIDIFFPLLPIIKVFNTSIESIDIHKNRYTTEDTKRNIKLEDFVIIYKSFKYKNILSLQFNKELSKIKLQ